MSQLEKRIARIMSVPTDYNYDEAKALLRQFGFIEDNKGATSGSRVKFYRERDKRSICLHKPHPGNIMKRYAVRILVEFLEGIGKINNND